MGAFELMKNRYVLTRQDEDDIERAIANDPGPQPNDAVKIRYSKATDMFVLSLRSGLILQVPRSMIEELHNVDPLACSHVQILGPGTGIAWDDVDIAVKTSTLIARVLSQGYSAATMGARGGSAKTANKATSARENGRKGGRPKKAA